MEKRYLVYILILLPIVSWAQQPLALRQAIDSALKNNFDIQIARNNSEIGKMSNTLGMAGALPSISITASDNNAISDINQRLNSGVDITKNNVSSNTLGAGLSAGVVLFNGFKVMATKERLNCLQKQSEIQLNQQVQSTIAAVMSTYYDILRQQTYLNIIQSSLDVSTKKLEIVTERYNVGMANEADRLQSLMDLNMAEQNLRSQQRTIEEEKTSLMQLMGVKQFFSFELRDTIIIDAKLQKDAVINELSNNPRYLSAEQQVKISEQQVKEVEAQRYPSLKLNAGYNFAYSNSSAGLYFYNRNYGPSVGATLQIPVFNGNMYKTQQNVAMYNVKNSELQKENALNTLKADAVKTFLTYESTLQQLKSQQANYDNARLLVDIVVQRFQLNQATILEVKAAQASYENAGYLLVNLQYAAKIAEIQLNCLTFTLKY